MDRIAEPNVFYLVVGGEVIIIEVLLTSIYTNYTTFVIRLHPIIV